MTFDITLILEKSKNSDNLIKGGNSFVRRVTHESVDYCVKNYSRRDDSHVRLLKEFNALKSLMQFDSTLFAKPFGYSLVESSAVFSWLSGSRPILNKPTVDLMISVIRELHIISLDSKKKYFENATDFIYDDNDIKGQIYNRFIKIVSNQTKIPQDLLKKLDGSIDLLPGDCSLKGSAIETLSVSDLGPHNLLWDESSNKLSCVDLEFFGWDDAHKLFVDTVLHPQINWNLDLASLFSTKFQSIFPLDSDRVVKLWKYLSFKWALIILERVVRNEALVYSSEEIMTIHKQVGAYALLSQQNVNSINDLIELTIESVKLNK
jgi:hypothetical protein